MAREEILSAKWKWDWHVDANGHADCGIFAEAIQGHAYAVVRCPRLFTKEQWKMLATYICDLHNLLKAENANLREEVALWKDRWESEHADHQRTIEHCDKQLKEI